MLSLQGGIFLCRFATGYISLRKSWEFEHHVERPENRMGDVHFQMVWWNRTQALGVETQRQWSDLAIERSTPCLLGLYSLVVLLGHALHPDGKITLQQAAWYPKPQATFNDVLATVRRHLWSGLTFQTSASHPDLCLVPRADLTGQLQAACY
jgi:hypothetical protein